MHCFVVNKVDNNEQNNINIKEHKNRIVFYDGKTYETYSLFKGTKYFIEKNSLNCNIDTKNISKNNREKLYEMLLNCSLKRSELNMYDKKNEQSIENCVNNFNEHVKYILPKEFIPLKNGFFDKNLNFKDTVTFKRKTIKGSIIIAKETDIKTFLENTQTNQTFTQNIDTIKNLNKKILIVTKDKINSIYNIIDNNKNKPKCIFIILSNEEFKNIDHNKTLCILTWDKLCSNIRKGSNSEIITLSTVNSQNKNINDLINISRVPITPNIIEKRILKGNGYTMKEAEDALNIISSFKYVDVDKNITECEICITDQANIDTECKHNLCLSCSMSLIMSNKKFICPFCRSNIDLKNCTINTKAIPSRLYTMNWIAKKYSKPIVYVDNKNDSSVLLRVCNKRIIMANDTDVATLNSHDNVVILCDKNDISKIACVSGIDAVICKSDNNEIIKNKNAYGKDFMSKNGFITLNLYYYNI